MSTKTFTAEELEGFIYSSSVRQQHAGEVHKTTQYMETIFADADGRLYRVNWLRDLSEWGEDSFYDTELEEVFPVPMTEAVYRTAYSTNPSDVIAPKIEVEDLKATVLLSDDAQIALDALRDFDFSEIEQLLLDSKAAMISDDASGLHAAALAFVKNMTEIQAKL